MKKKFKLIVLPKLKKELDAIWSKKVRERDGKCVMCGKTERLQAHHYIKTKARSLKYRWDIRNGITLCYGCHMYGVHKTASFEVVSGLVDYAVKNGVLTATEVGEIAHDKDKRDYGKERGFLEAARINLEQSSEQN
jgi:predicted restriction endonuclease